MAGESTNQLLQPMGISAINNTGCQPIVNVRAWGGFSVNDGAAKSITIMDAQQDSSGTVLSAGAKVLAVFDAPTRGSWLNWPVAVNGGNLIVSCVSASNINVLWW